MGDVSVNQAFITIFMDCARGAKLGVKNAPWFKPAVSVLTL